MKERLMTCALFLLLLYGTSLFAQDANLNLFDDFKEGWKEKWLERKFAGKSATFVVVEEDTNRVLEVEADGAGSALWYALDLKATDRSKISWRWKIDTTLSDKTRERKKIGDDYVARVYVVFEPHLVSWRTRALCYVWASKEPTNSIFRSPYTSSVGIIVLQSGNENRGEWVTEQRNLTKDYRKVFGKPPELLNGVAIMVDTDNTNQDALSWFDDLTLQVPAAKPDTTRGGSQIRMEP